MHFVAALDRVPGMRCVLGLFEGVVTGAADGYCAHGRTSRPRRCCTAARASANGLANLHNARRARHADRQHRRRPGDLPPPARRAADRRHRGLGARRLGLGAHAPTAASDVGADAAVAVQAARTPPGQIATLILPSDTVLGRGRRGRPRRCRCRHRRRSTRTPSQRPPRVLRAAAERAAHARRPGAARARRWRWPHRIAAATGARLLARDVQRPHRARPRAGLPIERVAVRHGPRGRGAAPACEHLILVGASAPVGFFAYPGKPSRLVPAGCRGARARRAPSRTRPRRSSALADELGAPRAAVARPGPAAGAGRAARSTPEAVAARVAALLPEEAIVADEAVTFGARLLRRRPHAAPPHDWLQLDRRGDRRAACRSRPARRSARPGRRVVNLQADGSAMYTLQALWTQAREKLPVTTVCCRNRKYQILHGRVPERRRQAGPDGAGDAGPGRPRRSTG